MVLWVEMEHRAPL
uniref:Uncharacterized protein n=1 Tax=Anguilla anguilla TaxID=7936 RepID=A0A0E9Q7A4_ANGAN